MSFIEQVKEKFYSSKRGKISFLLTPVWFISLRLMNFFSFWWLREFLIKNQLQYYGKDVLLKRGTMIDAPQFVSIGYKTQFGEYCHIKGGAKIKIGEWCQVASFVIITSGGHVIGDGLYYGNT